jgi:hypothetical protein
MKESVLAMSCKVRATVFPRKNSIFNDQATANARNHFAGFNGAEVELLNACGELPVVSKGKLTGVGYPVLKKPGSHRVFLISWHPFVDGSSLPTTSR